MLERGFLPDFSSEELAELEQTQNLAPVADDSLTIQNKRDLLWVSIDNNGSLGLDQLTVVQPLPAGKVKNSVAIADVATRWNDALKNPRLHSCLNRGSENGSIPSLQVPPRRGYGSGSLPFPLKAN